MTEANTTPKKRGGKSADRSVLETRNLSKKFGELIAVDSVDLSIERGTFHSIIGPNGAGKTTLFDLLSGAISPSEGEVLLNGQQIEGLPPHERVHLGLARSFQISDIFDGLTVEENVRLAVQSLQYDQLSIRDRFFTTTDTVEPIKNAAEEALDMVGLSDRADAPATSLPYGDRRRLEIGIVMAIEPEVVLLDEPTAGMSLQNTQDTIDLINSTLVDETVLLVEHDIDLVMEISDRITVLHEGRKLADGAPQEIANDGKVREVYLGTEASS